MGCIPQVRISYFTTYELATKRNLVSQIISSLVSATENVRLNTESSQEGHKQCILVSQSVHSLSHVQLFATSLTAAHQASLSITNSQSLLKLMSTESVMPSNHLILCRPLLLPPSIFPRVRVFQMSQFLPSCVHSFSISPSNEYSGQISFRIDWFDLLAGQGTLTSLLQHHSSKA